MGSIFMRAFPLLRVKRSQSAIPFLEEGSDAACRVVYKVSQRRIPFLSIVEICHRVLGRGGAERSECPPTPHAPAHPKVPALTMPRALPNGDSGLVAMLPPMQGATCKKRKRETRKPPSSPLFHQNTCRSERRD